MTGLLDPEAETILRLWASEAKAAKASSALALERTDLSTFVVKA